MITGNELPPTSEKLTSVTLPKLSTHCSAQTWSKGKRAAPLHTHPPPPKRTGSRVNQFCICTPLLIAHTRHSGSWKQWVWSFLFWAKSIFLITARNPVPVMWEVDSPVYMDLGEKDVSRWCWRTRQCFAWVLQRQPNSFSCIANNIFQQLFTQRVHYQPHPHWSRGRSRLLSLA